MTSPNTNTVVEQLAIAKADVFVREQSQGEWGDDLIEKDAKRLAVLLIDFAKTVKDVL